MNEDDHLSGRHRPAAYETGRSSTREILFITVATKNRKPLLARPEIHALLVECWRPAGAWWIGRYVLMPDHLHLFCARGSSIHTLEAWMRFWKADVTRQWPHPGEKPVWQRGHWDTRLRRGESYNQKWDYVRENPVRAGLVGSAGDWPYQGEMNFLPW